MFGFGEKPVAEAAPERVTEKRRKRKNRKKKKKAAAKVDAADAADSEEDDDEQDGFDELLGAAAPRSVEVPVTTKAAAPSAAASGEGVAANGGAAVSAQAMAALRAAQVIEAPAEQEGLEDRTNSIVAAAMAEGFGQQEVEEVMSEMFAASEAFDDLGAVRARLEAAQAAAAVAAVAAPAADVMSFVPAPLPMPGAPTPPLAGSVGSGRSSPVPSGAKKATGLERVSAPTANTTPVALPTLSSTPAVDAGTLGKLETLLGRATGPGVKTLDAAFVIQGLLARSPRAVALSLVFGRCLRNVVQGALQSFGEAENAPLRTALAELLAGVFGELGASARVATDTARDAVEVIESVGRCSHGADTDALDAIALGLAANLKRFGLGLFASGSADGAGTTPKLKLPGYGDLAALSAADLVGDSKTLGKLFKERDDARDRTARSLAMLCTDVQTLEVQVFTPASSPMETPEALRQAMEAALVAARSQTYGAENGNGAAAPTAGAGGSAASETVRAEVDSLRNTLADAMVRLSELQREMREVDQLVTVTRRALDQKTQQLQLATESTSSAEMAMRSQQMQAQKTEAALRAALDGDLQLRRAFGATKAIPETPEEAADEASEATAMYFENLVVYLKDSAKCLECLEELVRKENAEKEKIAKESLVYHSIGGMAAMTADLDAKAEGLQASIAGNVDSIIFIKEDMKEVVRSVPTVADFLRSRVPGATLAGHPMLSREHAALQSVAGSAARFTAQGPVEAALMDRLEAAIADLDEVRGSAEGAKKVPMGFGGLRA